MKKFTLTLSLVIMLLFAFPFCTQAAEKDYCVDNADIIFDLNEEDLEARLKELSEEIGMDVVVVTTNSLDGKSAMEYADDYYDYNGYAEDGTLFLVSMEGEDGDHDWWVSTKGYAIDCMTDYVINEVIRQECVGSLSNGDYYIACDKFASIVEDCCKEEKDSGKPYDTNNLYTNRYGKVIKSEKKQQTVKGIVISLIIAAVVALIVMLSVKRSYKPVRFNRSAANYLVDGSLAVTQSYEHFLYSTVSKTAKSDNSGSGGGSSTHTSSSGSTHGGGGGKF